ncbi:hypothetical protein IFM89_036587 [Coptis chinensis]|uniref:Uncharacterized protein n=1 Tax=Coptis chinensis TaxID=261450 RepID=A0A835LPY0_9MAGN|nr:hypothetical protein IFM89_036587 [Coptis chinensis]
MHASNGLILLSLSKRGGYAYASDILDVEEDEDEMDVFWLLDTEIHRLNIKPDGKYVWEYYGMACHLEDRERILDEGSIYIAGAPKRHHSQAEKWEGNCTHGNPKRNENGCALPNAITLKLKSGKVIVPMETTNMPQVSDLRPQ